MYISDTSVLDFPGRHRPDEHVIAGGTKNNTETLSKLHAEVKPCGPVWCDEQMQGRDRKLWLS